MVNDLTSAMVKELMGNTLANKIVADIVVIDSGYSGEEPANGVIGGINLSNIGSLNDYSDNVGHGTCVTNIIHNENPNSSIFCVKITDDILQPISQAQLINSLEFVLEKISCQIVNMSLGVLSIDDYSTWQAIIKKLLDVDIVIVSAFNNNSISYPAAFENVIGIADHGISSSQPQITFLSGDGVINVVMTKRYYRVVDNRGTRLLVQGSSFSAASITGKLSLRLSPTYCGIKVAKYELTKLSTCIKNGISSTVNREKQIIKSIKKAVVFPFNKEIHALASFSDLVSFEIIGYFDFPIGYYRGRRISDVLKYCSNDMIVHSIKELNWDDDFDTLICGHCREFSKQTNSEIIKQLMDKCIRYNKKMFSFDNIDRELSDINFSARELFYYPHVSQLNVPQFRFGKLRYTSTPVLGVFGTSSFQGKYTLQLMIRREMIRRGYKIGQIATEPTGYFFGADLVYPMGYNSSVNIFGVDAVQFLNEAIWKIEETKPDIIIVASQSGTVSFDYSNTQQLLFNQYEFLLGTLPDGIILCVNIYDPIDYILRTINFLESCIKTKVFLIAVSPLTLKRNQFTSNRNKRVASNESIQNFISLLASHTEIPIIHISNSNINFVVDSIEDYYS